MVTVSIKKKIDDKSVAEISLTDRITVLIGDSGTGKTYICNMLSERIDNPFYYIAGNRKNKFSTRVFVYDNLRTFERDLEDLELDGSILVLDEYAAGKLSSDTKLAGKVAKANKYTLIISRECTIKYNIGVESVKKVEYTHGIFKVTRYFTEENTNQNNDSKLMLTDCILTEDAKSGYQFLNTVFGSMIEVRSSKGNGSFPKLAKEYTKAGKKVLGILDYDIGGIAMVAMYNDRTEKQFLDNIMFIRLECFEQLVCSSDFILSKATDREKDAILNYEKYMSCYFEHRGVYFYKLLRNIMTVMGTEEPRHEVKLYSKDSSGCLHKECCMRDAALAANCKFRTDQKIYDTLHGRYEDMWKLYKHLKDSKQ